MMLLDAPLHFSNITREALT